MRPTNATPRNPGNIKVSTRSGAVQPDPPFLGLYMTISRRAYGNLINTAKRRQVMYADGSSETLTDRRIFFEQVIRDNLALGRRPDRAHLRPTHPSRTQTTHPGVFRTRIVNSGVAPSLQPSRRHSTLSRRLRGCPRIAPRLRRRIRRGLPSAGAQRGRPRKAVSAPAPRAAAALPDQRPQLPFRLPVNDRPLALGSRASCRCSIVRWGLINISLDRIDEYSSTHRARCGDRLNAPRYGLQSVHARNPAVSAAAAVEKKRSFCADAGAPHPGRH